MADQTYTPSFKAAGTANDSTNSTTVAPSYPSGGSAPAAGDIAIAFITKDSSTTISAPDGTWTEITTVAYSTTYRVSAFWKRMSGGESGSVTFTFGAQGGTGNHGNGQIYLFQDCQRSGTPYEGVNTTNGSSAAQTIPSVTFTSGPRLLVIVDGYGDNLAGTPPATGGYSEWADTGTAMNAGDDGNQHIWGKTLGTGGGTDSPGNCTHGGTAAPWGAIGFALKGYINIDVTAATPTLSGQSVGQDKVFSYTSASLSTTGTTLTIERVASIAELSVQGQTIALDKVAGSIDFVFDQAALSTSGSTLTSDESSAVTEAALESTGQTVTFILGKNCDVTEAALSTSGQEIIGDEAVVFTEAALSTQGSAVVGDETILVTSADLSTSGSTITFNIAINCAVVEASLSTLGQSIGQDGVLNFTQVDLSSAGSDITLSKGVSFNLVEAALSTQGQDIALNRGYDCAVTQADLSTQGQTLTLYPSYSIDVVQATTEVTGQTLALDLGGHKQLAVDPATTSISGSELTYDKGVNITAAALSTEGKAVGLDKVFSYTAASLTAQGIDIVGDEAVVFTTASLSTAGSALTSDESSAVGSASLTVQGIAVIGDEAVVFTKAALSVAGSVLTGDESVTVGVASLTAQGQVIVLDKTSGINCPVIEASLSTVGTTLTIEKMAGIASLSIQGQEIDIFKASGRTIIVDPASLSSLGTDLTIVRYANKASLSISGTRVTIQKMASSAAIPIETSWIDLVNSMGQPTYTLDLVPATFSISPQWVQLEQAREFNEGILTVNGISVPWDKGILVTHAQPALAGSDVGFVLYTSQSVDVTQAQPIITGQDVVFQTTQLPVPDLQVEQADLVVQGVNVTLEQPPLAVVSASITVTGQDVLLTPFGLGNICNVDHAAFSVVGQEVALVTEGSFTFNVTNAALSLEGQIVGLIKAAVIDNQGLIDGFSELVINTPRGSRLLYPKDGGYYVISDD